MDTNRDLQTYAAHALSGLLANNATCQEVSETAQQRGVTFAQMMAVEAMDFAEALRAEAVKRHNANHAKPPSCLKTEIQP